MAERRRILIIDDDADVRDVARISMEMLAGWEVLTAGSGEEGIATAAAAQPDAVLLDVMMPGLDGPATMQRLRADESTRGIPVIMLTARVQSTDRVRFDRLGVDGVITKPFNPSELVGQVARALGWDAPNGS